MKLGFLTACLPGWSLPRIAEWASGNGYEALEVAVWPGTGGRDFEASHLPVTDFPAPILDGTAPANSATLFGPITQGATSGGPCLVEPETDVIYPQNWLRPRFTWTAANGDSPARKCRHLRRAQKPRTRNPNPSTSSRRWSRFCRFCSSRSTRSLDRTR